MSLQKYRTNFITLISNLSSVFKELKDNFLNTPWLFKNYYLNNTCGLMCLNCSLWTAEAQNYEPDESSLPLFVNITGGDPLFSPRLIDMLIRLKKAKRQIFLTNNGLNYLKVDKKIFTLVDVPVIYMPGPERQTLLDSTGLDCYRDYLSVFELFQELKKKFVVKFTVTADNFELIPDMVQLIRNYPRAVLWLAVSAQGQALDPQMRKYLWYNAQKKHVLIYEPENYRTANKFCFGCEPQLEKISFKNILFILKLLIKLYF